MKSERKNKNKKNEYIETAGSANSAGMGIKFFVDMPLDLRNEIVSYLSEKDFANLMAVSREFHGPVEKVNLNAKQYGKTVAKKTHEKLMKPTSYILNKIKHPKPKNDADVMLTTGVILWSPVWLPIFSIFAVANKGIAVSSKQAAFFLGSAKTKIKEKKINRNIRPYTEEQITFTKKP